MGKPMGNTLGSPSLDTKSRQRQYTLTMTTLTFDKSAAEFVLESFDKATDNQGYVIDPTTGER